jgi:hypothetical protein
MGEAYSAAAEDADALYWNPAALTNIEHKSAVFMDVPYLASSFYDYAAYGQSLGAHGAFGVGLQYFSAGAIPETDQIGTSLGSYSPYDLALSLGYAYKFNGGYSAGAAAKLIRSSLLDTAQTTAVDVGLLSPSYFDGKLKLAFTAANIGSPLDYGDGAKENLPQTFKLGSSYRGGKDWLTTFDLAAPRGAQPYADIGTEYWIASEPKWGVAARMGYNTLTISGLQGLTGTSFGIGVRINNMTADYALVPYGILGFTHRISLTMRWDKVRVNIKMPNVKALYSSAMEMMGLAQEISTSAAAVPSEPAAGVSPKTAVAAPAAVTAAKTVPAGTNQTAPPSAKAGAPLPSAVPPHAAAASRTPPSGPAAPATKPAAPTTPAKTNADETSDEDSIDAPQEAPHPAAHHASTAPASGFRLGEWIGGWGR